MKTYDVAVVGLGAVGSAALYQLSKIGVSVIGIDRFTPPHNFGSSFGESRATRQAIGEGDFYTPLVLRANELWNEIEHHTGVELYKQCGMLIAGYEEQLFMQNTLNAANKFSIEHKILSGGEVEDRFPAMQTKHSDQLFYYEPTSGYLRPEKIIETQLRLARDNGAEIILSTLVRSIKEQASGVRIHLDNGDEISAEKVVVSSGPWMKELFPDILNSVLKTYLQTLYWFDIDKSHYESLKPSALPVFLCGFEKAPRTRAFSGFPALSGPDGGIKFTMDESDTEITPNNKDTIKPNATVAQDLYEHVASYLRYMKPTVLRSYNCVYTATPDWDFIIDFAPNSKRVVIGSACSSHGFKYAAVTGELLAQLATKGTTSFDIRTFSFDRLVRK